jgi:hypothetical protein
MYSIGSAMQSADFSDTAALPAFVSDISHALELLRQHGLDEDQFIFPSLREHAPDMVAQAEEQHRQIEEKIGSLHAALLAVAAEPDPLQRIGEGESMNRQLNDLLAYYLMHLCFEENTLLPVSWEVLTDGQIFSIRESIQSNMPPERYGDFLRLMLPSANNFELVSVLTTMKASAPPPALQGLVSLAAELLPPARVTLIRERAGV